MAREAGTIGGDFYVASYDVQERLYYDHSRRVGDAAREMLPKDLVAHVSFRAPGTAMTVREDYGDDAIELLFIDANHSHPWPTLDLLATLDSLRPGALVVLHDINLPLISQEFPSWGVKWVFDGLDVEKEIPAEALPNIGLLVIPEDKGRVRTELQAIASDRPWEVAVTDDLTATLLSD